MCDMWCVMLSCCHLPCLSSDVADPADDPSWDSKQNCQSPLRFQLSYAVTEEDCPVASEWDVLVYNASTSFLTCLSWVLIITSDWWLSLISNNLERKLCVVSWTETLVRYDERHSRVSESQMWMLQISLLSWRSFRDVTYPDTDLDCIPCIIRMHSEIQHPHSDGPTVRKWRQEVDPWP